MAEEASRRRLGRGLAALIGDAARRARRRPDRARAAARCRSTLLRPNPRNPRKTFDDGDLADLAASIREQGRRAADPGPPGRRAAARATRSSPASGAGARRSGPGCTKCRSSSMTSATARRSNSRSSRTSSAPISTRSRRRSATSSSSTSTATRQGRARRRDRQEPAAHRQHAPPAQAARAGAGLCAERAALRRPCARAGRRSTIRRRPRGGSSRPG